MDIDLPGYAWDLLPFKKEPLDLYRAPMWHAEYDFKKRTPYASLVDQFRMSILRALACDKDFEQK